MIRVGTSELLDPRAVLVAAAVSGAGHVVHNLAEFPPGILLGPETLVPLGVTVALAWAMLRRPGRGAYLPAAAWAALVTVVGGASVFPLAVWPFYPEQTVSHYAVHLAYAAAQLPLLWLAGRWLLTER